MKTITIIGLLIFTTMSYCQIDKHHERNENLSVKEKAEKQTDKMTEILSLSEEQKEKVFQVNLTHIEKMEALKIERDALKEKMKAAKDFTKSELDSILSPEQKSILEDKRQEHEKKRKVKHEKCLEQKKDE